MLATLLALSALAPAAETAIEVPFRIGEDAIIVDARVNGRPVSLMFDTGFGGAVVLDNTIDIGKPTGKMGLRDFVGEFEAPVVKIKSLTLGSMKLDSTEMDAVQQPPGGYSFAYGQHCDGIMGFETIKNYVTEINFQRQRFIFHPKTEDIGKRIPDNKKTFLTKLLPIGANAMEMAVTTPSGKTMTLALDTGNAFYATTHRDVLERVGLWDSAKTPKFTRLSGVASGAVDSWSFQMPPIKIFGIPVKETVWDVIDLPSSSAEGDGTVGFGFLSNFNITVDYDRRRVWFENWKTPIEGTPEGDLGISAGYSPDAKRTIVARVSPDSPAEKAGIKEGDSILSVDTTDVHDFGYRKMRKLLSGPIGSKVNLATSRSGNLRRVELVRQALVNQ